MYCNVDDVTIRVEVLCMEKTTTLNLRVNPNVKKSAEEVLSKLGIPMSVAIDMYLNQIVLTQGIPFSVTLPKSINADLMSKEELLDTLQKGYESGLNGYVRDAKTVFQSFNEDHKG